MHSSRILVGAPRAWTATGTLGAVVVVDYAVELIDRPMAIDSTGRRVNLDLSQLQEDVPGISPADIEARYTVLISAPVVLLAPGTTAHVQSNGTVPDIDAMQVPGSMPPVGIDWGPGSYFGASIGVIGEAPLPIDAGQSPIVAMRRDETTCAELRLRGYAACDDAHMAATARAEGASTRSAVQTGTVVGIGAPGAGRRSEGMVLLVWLGPPTVSSVEQRHESTDTRLGLDAAMMYARSEPSALLTSMPRVLAWRVLAPESQSYCRAAPGFCVPPPKMRLPAIHGDSTRHRNRKCVASRHAISLPSNWEGIYHLNNADDVTLARYIDNDWTECSSTSCRTIPEGTVPPLQFTAMHNKVHIRVAPGTPGIWTAGPRLIHVQATCKQ